MHKLISVETAFIRQEALFERGRLLDHFMYVTCLNTMSHAAVIELCLRAFGRFVEFCVIQ